MHQAEEYIYNQRKAKQNQPEGDAKRKVSTICILHNGSPDPVYSPYLRNTRIITADTIEAALGREVKYDASLTDAAKHAQLDPAEGAAEADFRPKSPGMKYKHYAPKAEMLIVEGERSKVKAEIERLKAMNEKLGNSVGVILFEEKAFLEAAHDFFARLRDLDNEGVDMILAGALSDSDGVGFAVMNRMLKSAGYNIVKV